MYTLMNIIQIDETFVYRLSIISFFGVFRTDATLVKQRAIIIVFIRTLE